MAKLLTIGQLASHCGVTVRAVRHYHRVGLLPEPVRDNSGYRRYGAQAVVDLVRIKVLADAGVPLAQVSHLLNADPDEFGAAVAGIDEALQQQIGQLEHRRQQLVGLLAGDQLVLPSEVAEMLSDLREMGVSEQGVQIERDGWILLAALSPEVVPEWTRQKRAALADPEFRRIYLAYDGARDWDPADPRLKPLADRTVEWTSTRHDAVVGARPSTLPSEPNVVLVAQLMDAESAYTSPALNRLAELCRSQLNPPARPRRHHGSSQDMTEQPDLANITDQISQLLSEYRIPSAAIGILHDGTITDFAVGLMNLPASEPATTDTIYQCGSMTKTWTALAFMQLVDEGRVGLDEPVRTYLEGFKVADPDVTAMVTPRHFLNHTNGIEETIGDPGEDVDVYERMVRNIADAPQVFPLGYTHGYSAALGYAVLARIMEVVDGKPWDTIMKDRLFDPLQLSSTSSFPEQVDQDRAATGYLIRSLEGDPIPSPVARLPRSYGPGGNVSSTPREVLTMAHAFLHEGEAPNGRRIVSGAAIREMTESRVPVPDPYLLGSEWALGLTVYHWHGETVFAHDGSTIGQHARLRILPNSNLAVTMMANGGPRDSLYRKVFNAILTELGAVTVPDLPQADPHLKLNVSKYEGAYGRPGSRYEVIAEGGNLTLSSVLDPMHARVLGKPPRITYKLLPIDETHFLMPSDDPMEDTQTVALYDFKNGVAQYLHTNARVNPRVSD